MPEVASRPESGAFPLKQCFGALFNDSGVDNAIASYVWADYVSQGDPVNAFEMYTLAKDKTKQYPEPCDSPQEAHAYVHSWIVRYIAPSADEIVNLLRQVITALSMFFTEGSMFEFANASCGASDRDNPQKFFYHEKNGWRTDTDAFKEFMTEVRSHLMKLPVRREHGEDSYRIATWGDFERLMVKKIYRQIEDQA